MLTSHLNDLNPPKVVTIHDNLTVPGQDILLSMIKMHLSLKKHKVHFFVFETNKQRIANYFLNNQLYVYDCVTPNSWSENKSFIDIISDDLEGVIVIDSVIPLIFEYGIGEVYRILHKLCEDTKIVQIATTLHKDCLESNTQLQIINYFDHISTLSMKLFPMPSGNPRLEYTFKKSGTKLIKKVEEYYFENKNFFTKPPKKINIASLLPTNTQSPENLASFRISLDDSEKASRENLQLPYIKNAKTDFNVIYNLDDEDDWDDEDPDDDLDI